MGCYLNKALPMGHYLNHKNICPATLSKVLTPPSVGRIAQNRLSVETLPSESQELLCAVWQ